MKPTAKQSDSLAPLLAFGAHPDDIEFGCGGIIARETRAGRKAHFVVCSRGESASRGTPAVRTREARKAAALLGASIEFVTLDGDAQLEVKPAHSIMLAAIIRKVRPGLVLAPSLVENQHPDHHRLGRIVRDASRLARYGGVMKLRPAPAHAIGPLLYYAVTDEAEPAGMLPIVVDISSPLDVGTWTASMAAHASQLRSRNYVELQLSRARVLGLRSGVEYAQALFPNDPLVFDSLAPLTRASRRF
ncbi:MAG TPA: PIG-L family deacetylase [Opitutaceae bacterium]|jgi:LmbE family N-acetylglucosaminyl deacetylase|nr:PIG-L family deacetylase [Opitutaceae bacterium]